MRKLDLGIACIDQNQILRCLGYRSDVLPSPEVTDVLNRCIHEARQSVQPRGAYAVVPIVCSGQHRIVTEKGPIKSRILADIAARAEQMAFCLVTLGKTFDPKIEENGDLLQTCIWDAVGTTLVEHSVDLLLAQVRRTLGVETSLPFSPGYCDWALEGQKLIFSAFGDAPLGIKVLSDSWMMIPQKSVSFVVCLDVEEKAQNPCHRCGLKRCFMRR